MFIETAIILGHGLDTVALRRRENWSRRRTVEDQPGASGKKGLCEPLYGEGRGGGTVGGTLQLQSGAIGVAVELVGRLLEIAVLAVCVQGIGIGESWQRDGRNGRMEGRGDFAKL